ncbi:hypothetical protein GA0115234_101849 [Streptomyces sp. DvalAA-43]|jgi:hypothetical protein|nr:hypothetical protein GA0115234_101849 [Streptomyces sp. DvalAA-43]
MQAAALVPKPPQEPGLVPCPALNATPEGAPVGLDLINGIPAHVSTS